MFSSSLRHVFACLGPPFQLLDYQGLLLTCYERASDLLQVYFRQVTTAAVLYNALQRIILK